MDLFFKSYYCCATYVCILTQFSISIRCAARDLGLPLLNPYLDRGADFTHGVNFAVGGATALSTATLARRGITIPHTNSSLEVQIRWFKEFMSSTTNHPRG
jgi:hypothetical protein